METDTLIPGSCLICRQTIWISPRLGATFDLIAPKGPGDVRMLALHGCCYEEKFDEWFDPEDDW